MTNVKKLKLVRGYRFVFVHMSGDRLKENVGALKQPAVVLSMISLTLTLTSILTLTPILTLTLVSLHGTSAVAFCHRLQVKPVCDRGEKTKQQFTSEEKQNRVGVRVWVRVKIRVRVIRVRVRVRVGVRVIRVRVRVRVRVTPKVPQRV